MLNSTPMKNTTTPTNWVIVPFPAAGSTVGTNTLLDSVGGLFLGARVNHTNTGAGAGIIAYAAGGIPKTIEISAHGSFKSSAAGFLIWPSAFSRMGFYCLNRCFLPQIQLRQPQDCIL